MVKTVQIKPYSHPDAKHTVILLHGIAQSAWAMRHLASALAKDYQVLNVAYPSVHKPIAQLAREVGQALSEYISPKQPISFVAHSMGGLVTRYCLAENPHWSVSRVVLLGTPHRGSEIADFLNQGFKSISHWIFGPAFKELTVAEMRRSPPPRLSVPVGVLLGKRSFDPLLPYLLKEKPNDGRVTLSSAHYTDMTDFRLLPVNHFNITRHPKAVQQVRYFLKHGHFSK